jgi:hypothetical protein
MNKRLKDYAYSVTSQFGEDGILARIFEVLSIRKGECVEFGAWDGKLYSNTYNLIANAGWKGVLIEGSASRFGSLLETYKDRKDLCLLNRYVGLNGNDGLDAILATTGISAHFDLLSIDIDGNDYHVWSDLNDYQPKVVVIEINPSIPTNVYFVQERNQAVKQGSSLLALQRLGREKGYELIESTLVNAFFVKRELFPYFEIKDNTLDAIYNDTQCQTQIFQLFDGTIKISGCKKLLWHNIDINEEDLQLLPKEKRLFPDGG